MVLRLFPLTVHSFSSSELSELSESCLLLASLPESSVDPNISQLESDSEPDPEDELEDELDEVSSSLAFRFLSDRFSSPTPSFPRRSLFGSIT